MPSSRYSLRIFLLSIGALEAGEIGIESGGPRLGKWYDGLICRYWTAAAVGENGSMLLALPSSIDSGAVATGL